MDGHPTEGHDFIVYPDKKFVVIMKDGKIYKDTIQQINAPKKERYR